MFVNQRFFLVCLMVGAMASTLQGQPPAKNQNRPIDQYVSALAEDYTSVATAPSSQRTPRDIERVLPLRRSQRFAEYAASSNDSIAGLFLGQFIPDISKLLLNRQVGSPGGATGVTSLVSRVAAPAFLGFGVEYGNILESATGTTTTLRANLLGVSRMLLGAQQFPNCFEIDQQHCTTATRWLRRFSGVVAFENTNVTTATGVAVTPSVTSPVGVDLFGNGFRMRSWGARFNITRNDPHDPKFKTGFADVIKKLRAGPEAPALTGAVSELFGPQGNIDPVYTAWQVETVTRLQNAAGQDAFRKILDDQFQDLIKRMTAAHPDFPVRVAALVQTSQAYFESRDQLLQALQSHQFTLEYSNQHPQNQFSTSTVRFIYSHQPSVSPILLTANAAISWYNSPPSAPAVGRLRDVQAAGQLDRRLGQIGSFGNAVATFGAYYQWMKEDALIVIGPGNVAPGSGIVLPGSAAQLLGTKGNIWVVQGKLSFPLNNTIRIPISVTGANRTELIDEQDIRGQVGITLDLDGLFTK